MWGFVEEEKRHWGWGGVGVLEKIKVGVGDIFFFFKYIIHISMESIFK